MAWLTGCYQFGKRFRSVPSFLARRSEKVNQFTRQLLGLGQTVNDDLAATLQQILSDFGTRRHNRADRVDVRATGYHGGIDDRLGRARNGRDNRCAFDRFGNAATAGRFYSKLVFHAFDKIGATLFVATKDADSLNRTHS